MQDREGAGSYRAPRANFKLTDFDIVGRIGDGSFSTCILARLRESGELFAIKMVNKHLVLRNRMAEYVRNERHILDVLDHPSIVRLKFTFQDVDSLYFGMEYCPGGDLYEQISKRGHLPLDAVRFYSAEVVQMLEYLKHKQIVHRDLKPENLLLTADGHLKVIDFGSAKAAFLPAVGGTGKQSRATSFVGTAEYVSPEVLNNTPLSYPADLWALGCIVFQMLAGRAPFKGASEYLTFQKVSAREFEFPDDFPPVARDLVDALLQMNPEDRLGAADLEDLKRHPFFEGIQWSSLREQQAPEFILPPAPSASDEALDWELTSIVRDNAGPLQYTTAPQGAGAAGPAAAQAGEQQYQQQHGDGSSQAAAYAAGQAASGSSPSASASPFRRMPAAGSEPGAGIGGGSEGGVGGWPRHHHQPHAADALHGISSYELPSVDSGGAGSATDSGQLHFGVGEEEAPVMYLRNGARISDGGSEGSR